jgi:hypothetical protein
MSRVRRAGVRALALVTAILFLPEAAFAALPVLSADGPSNVRIVHDDAGYRLLVNGQPFYVKGAGLEGGPIDALVAAGGNSFRTWRSDGGAAVLDRARAKGVYVALGIDVGHERHGFSYDDPQAVAAQLARIRGEVLQFKDHPALLIWVVGNELNLGASNPKVWNAINQIALMIHQLDPNHPVMTTLAGFDKALIDQLKARAPALDLIGIQLYGDISQLQEKLRASDWTGPYIVTEWGPTGHWEIAKTTWGAPIEDDSTRKADLLRERYQRYIVTDQRQCLGSYVFLWGNKQERTPTWYGLFLASGEATAGVDAMQYLWTGAWPDNRSPAIAAIEIDSRSADQDITLLPDHVYGARVQADDSDRDLLKYRWLVLEESAAQSSGGDHEETPRTVAASVVDAGNGAMRFQAPSKPGAYRLFVYVYDHKGHAAHANIPFMVADSK